MESTAVDNVVYTGNNKIFKVHARLRVLQYFYDLPADVYKLYNRRIHVRWRVHRRWRVQQSTTLCTLVTTEYLKYIRGCVYNNIFDYLSADVYKLYNRRSSYPRPPQSLNPSGRGEYIGGGEYSSRQRCVHW